MELVGRSATEYQRINAQLATSKSVIAVLQSLLEVQSTIKLFESKLTGLRFFSPPSFYILYYMYTTRFCKQLFSLHDCTSPNIILIRFPFFPFLPFPSFFPVGDYFGAAECIKVIDAALDQAAEVGASKKRCQTWDGVGRGWGKVLFLKRWRFFCVCLHSSVLYLFYYLSVVYVSRLICISPLLS
jgi:hypothetical protein